MLPGSGSPISWWRYGVVYQIYPRSFADGNGDGVGDLAGVRAHLDHLAWLGVDAIWFAPFYPSPMVDGGYDVADYRDIHPDIGTLAEFDDLLTEAHAHGIRVVVDLVPNHTSDRHPWFQAALADRPGGPARSRYVFMDGEAAGRPPSDWRSHFGGSAWEPVGDGQWYLHLFLAEQPDLNWLDPEVRSYFQDVLRFWCDRGVDGFRVDAAHCLVKDLRRPLRSQPHLDHRLPVTGDDPVYDRDEVHQIYREWRTVLDGYQPPRMAVAETWSPTSFRTYLYARPDELGQAFDFALLKAPWDRTAYLAAIRKSIADAREYAGQPPTWVLSSHDVVRHASRLGLGDADDLHWLRSLGTEPAVDREVGLRRARAATLLVLALPGSVYLYQGEELGLPEVPDIPDSALRDPVVRRTGGHFRGRDGCRVPLPWRRDEPHLGFSGRRDGPAAEPWLPQPGWLAEYAADSQRADRESTLWLYRDAIAMRKRLQPADDAVTFLDLEDPGTLRFERSNGVSCLVNFRTDPVRVPGKVLICSDPAYRSPGEGDGGASAPPESTTWFIPHVSEVTA